MTKETKILLGIGIVTILIVLIGIFVFGTGSTNKPQTTQKAQIATTSVDQKLLVRDDSNKISYTTAKVTLVEFGDYQCPACGAADPTVEQILTSYKGKVNFVFRNFPLQMHQNAQIGAEAAEAAGAQGKYWEMHKMLYDKQLEWGESNKPIDYFLTYAKTLKLDTNQFQQAIQGKQFEKKIREDQSDGNALGIDATPTFFLNGRKVTLVASYNELTDAVKDFVKQNK